MSPLKADKLKPSKTPSSKRVAFLIAVRQKREAMRVYAVLTLSADEAIFLVQDLAAAGATIELAGTLSHWMARSLKLKPDKIRLI